jgi:aryl-alcohol dehydrogenase-like predicted oxidoreductase
MRYRPLGRTGLQVSELSVGISPAGEDTRAAAAMLAMAFDRGINTVTIAGDPLDATRLLADSLRSQAGAGVHVVLRAPSLVRFDLPSPHVPVQQAWPGAHLRAMVERLLAGARLDRLALVQLHAWCPEWLHEGDWLETLERLRAEGKIAGFGVSLFDHDVDAATEVVASGAIDAVQLMYNIFDPAAAAALLPLCQKHGVGVVARSPLYYGALTPGFPDGPGFAEGDWRRSYFFADHRHETAGRVRKLASLVEPPDRSVADLAVRFALSHPAVSTVAVGMRQCAHLEANLQAIAAGPLSAELQTALWGHRWLC